MSFWSRDPFKALAKSLGKGKLFREPEDIALYGMDATHYRGEAAAVVLAEVTEDVQETVRFAVKQEMTVTARGAGSGLSGGSVPVEGGIVLSLERMRRIEPINLKDRIVVVQPGVVTTDLQAQAAKYRLFYPPDPSSHTVSTIGGNVAENAGGLRCFKYGVTSHYVRGLEYVDADGELELTGAMDGEAHEPDLTPLLVGSEGTLGIFTRIELQLILLPPATITLAAYFSRREAALGAVEEIVKRGLEPSILEFIDRGALTASAQHIGISYPDAAQALLLIETDGAEEEANRAAIEIAGLLESRAIQVERATAATDRERLWRLRRAVSPSLIRLASGRIHEDVAVPRGKIGALAEAVETIAKEKGLEVPVYGHAGDGNLHVVVLFDAANAAQAKAAEKASQDVFRAAIGMGGTITGEHGIGCAKREFLTWQLRERVIGLSRDVKKQLDPLGVFNPGKVLP